MSSHPSRGDSGWVPNDEESGPWEGGRNTRAITAGKKFQGESIQEGRRADQAKSWRKQQKLGCSGTGGGGRVAHPIPAAGGQAAPIGAEATAVYRARMSPQFGGTGKVFCLLWQCQQLPWPQPHCEILCNGKRGRGRFPERGSKTSRRPKTKAIMGNEGTAPREGGGPGQGSAITRVHRRGCQALPAPALQLSLSSSLPHLHTLPLPVSRATGTQPSPERELRPLCIFTSTFLSPPERNPSIYTVKALTGQKLKGL